MEEYLKQELNKHISFYTERLDFWRDELESRQSELSSKQVQYYSGLLMGLYIVKADLECSKE